MRFINILTLVLSLVAIVVSAIAFWETSFHQDLSVYAGRQVRLFVVWDPNDKREEKPLVLLPVTYVNDGGKSVVVFDTKLKVKIKSQGRTVVECEFVALREVSSILKFGSEIEQSAILPIVVPGKSSETRLFGFVPTKHISQAEIPPTFSLDISVYTLDQEGWEFRNEYSISEVSEIWQDLKEEGPVYQGSVHELIPSGL